MNVLNYIAYSTKLGTRGNLNHSLLHDKIPKTIFGYILREI